MNKSALRKLRDLFEKITHTRIFRRLPHGLDLSYDLRHKLPTVSMHTIFDVGANIGQSIAQLKTLYPTCVIYAFEPSFNNFQLLAKNVDKFQDVHLFQTALGSEIRAGLLDTSKDSQRYRLMQDCRDSSSDVKGKFVEEVTVDTLEQIFNKQMINSIDFLKIDTEGNDLNVLRGGESLLEQRKIGIIQVEVGMNPTNMWHVPFFDVTTFLAKFGYYLFGIYEQIHEWPTRAPHLRRANAVYISPIIRDSNTTK